MALALVAMGRTAPIMDTAAIAQSSGPPNVLIVLTDDQREGLEVMPKTRRFFKTGARFPKAVVTTPLCCPSRISILSGLYVHNHGVSDNKGTGLSNVDHSSTLPAYLQEAGYKTAYFGKYLHPMSVEEPPKIFEDWALPHKRFYYGATWNMNGDILTVPTYTTDFLSDLATDYIDTTETEDDTPWFMMVAPNAPHNPFSPSAKYKDAVVPKWNRGPAVVEQDLSDKPPHNRGSYRWWLGRYVRKVQYRTLMSVDDMMGAIDRKLTETAETDNTLVFYLSDNGFMWTEHGLYGKATPYSPSLEVPFLMRWPGHVEPSVDDRLVANIDIAPTVLEAAGIDQEFMKPMDGKSILSSEPRERILVEYLIGFRWAGIRTPHYQFTEYYDQGPVPYWQEYYNLMFDPYELDSLLGPVVDGEMPSWAVQLSQQLAQARTCSGSTCP